jgi:pimeloyl-ACP methyl ester carboxylesterase
MATRHCLAAAFAATALLPAGAGAAACPAAPANYKATFVTYYSKPDQPQTSADPRCSIVRNGSAGPVCRIRMRGILYEPTKPAAASNPYPAIVYNHGSGRNVHTTGDGKCVDNFFVPKGYVVLHPFRRGHGQSDTATADEDDTVADNTSTGRYFADVLQELEATGSPLGVPASCLPLFPDIGKVSECYEAALVEAQTDDVVEAFKWLKARPGVDKNAMAVMGSSYGAISTVLFNRESLGQRAVVSFAAGSQSWGHQDAIKVLLIAAAVRAQEPAFYLQAKWDVDTRPTVELSSATALSASDPRHGKRYQAAIWDYPLPANDPDTGEPDYDAAHVGFSRAHDRWGVAVLDFLQRYGVK